MKLLQKSLTPRF